jgi:sarcosine oxidase subunit beta
MRASADVVIVGGGCMGASVAYHLSRRGVTNVVLIEREAMLGAGSTGRNAGGFRHQFSHAANIALSIESVRLLERFEDEVGYPADVHQDGYLFLLSSLPSVASFRANVALQRSMGVAVEWLEPDDAASVAPGITTEGLLAATFCARDGVADPNGVTMGFVKASQAAGVEVARETEVTDIDVDSGRITGVTTTRGRIAAPVVVNAAGPQAGLVARLAGVELPVRPFRRHIFIAQPPPGVDWDRPTDGRRLVPPTRVLVIDFESTFYFHREGANVLFGMGDPAEPSGFDMTVRWDFLDEVTAVALRRLPALGDAAVSHAWAGLYEMTPDAMPVIGEAGDPRGLFFINGFSGHGFQHSPAAGRILADLITGRDPRFDLAPFAFSRFAQGAAGGEGNVV